jgi:hypothetical protein
LFYICIKLKIMKRILILAAFAGVLASCGNAGKNASLAQQVDSLRNEIARKELIDSVSRSVAVAQPVNVVSEYPVASPVSMVAVTPQHTHARHTTHRAARTAYAHSRSSQYAGYRAPSYAYPATQPAKTHKDWSAKAKGGIIGAGAGAVAGALIDHKKGRGALIGGLLGAGSGIGIGALLDSRR